MNGNRIERMKGYIERTSGMEDRRYSLDMLEADALYEMARQKSLILALVLAFDYGRAKGTRCT